MTAPTSISGLGEFDYESTADTLGQVFTFGAKIATDFEPQLKAAGEKLATEIIRKVIIESEVSPPIVIDLQQKPAPGEVPRTDWIGKLVKPRVTLDTTLGPMVIEPVGPPGPTKWPYIKWGLIGFGAVAVVLMVRGAIK